ncbi:MAG: hypothetical protein FWJ90_14095, partial [Actinomadura sp.]
TMILRRPARAEARAGRRAKARKRPSKRPRVRETPAPMPVPLSAPVPGDYGTPAAPAPKPPFAPDPLEFEEAGPLLQPRRPRRRPDPPPGIEEEPPAREPAPQGEGTVVVEGRLVDDPPEPGPVPDDPEPARGNVPLPREDPGRTENRGGAIYVLREDQDTPDLPDA